MEFFIAVLKKGPEVCEPNSATHNKILLQPIGHRKCTNGVIDGQQLVRVLWNQ